MFKVAKYSKNDDGGFNHLGYDEYQITYKLLNNTKFQIIVNNKLTKHSINILNLNERFRHNVLCAVSDYKNGLIVNEKCEYKKYTKLAYIKTIFNSEIIKTIEHNIMKINKEENRDVITTYKLI